MSKQFPVFSTCCDDMAEALCGSDLLCNYEKKHQKSSFEEEGVRSEEQSELKATVRRDSELEGESEVREERTKMSDGPLKEEEEEPEGVKEMRMMEDKVGDSVRMRLAQDGGNAEHDQNEEDEVLEGNETRLGRIDSMRNVRQKETQVWRPGEMQDGGNVAEVKGDQGTSEKGRLEEQSSGSKCEICGNGEMKYRCPGCSLRTCSAICVKNHKQGTGCTGMRDKTRFVSLHSFTESHLLSDYRFLEDVSRVTDGLFRDRRMRAPSNARLQVLLRNKALKHAIDLRLMPYGFTKHKQNFLFFHQKQDKMYWSMKLLFPQSGAEYFRKRIPEDQTLRSILTEYIDPKIADPIVRQRLKVYCATDSSSVQLFMKVEGQRADNLRYYNLEMDKTIVQNLARKTIFEYPTVHVVLPSSAHTYHLPELPAALCTS